MTANDNGIATHDGIETANEIESESEPETEEQRTLASRVIHGIDRASFAAAATAWVVAALVVGTVTTLAVLGFPEKPTELFWTVCAGTTVVMTFMIQHTQSRLQTATQLKLDELLKSAPLADDRLVHIETGGDNELVHHERRLREHRSAVRGDS